MLPRVLCIRLESPLENPETRSDVDADELRARSLAQRPRLVADALTIVRAFVVAGSPAQPVSRWGGFDAWVQRIVSALVWCGAPDPMGARRGLRADEDPGRGAERVLVLGWDRACQDMGAPCVTAKKMIDKLYPAPRDGEPPDGYDELREAIDYLTNAKPGSAPSGKALGAAIRKLKARPIAGRKLIPDGTTGGSDRWRSVAVG
jgi:hypothetical protein